VVIGIKYKVRMIRPSVI